MPLLQKLNLSVLRALWASPLPLGWKKSVYKKLCKLQPAPDAPFTTSFFGLQYEGNLNSSIEFSIYYYGAFEKPLLFFLRDFMQNVSSGRDNAAFVDVGANIGQHSLFMSQFAHQVYSFEPYGVVRSRLEHHIALNNLDNIQVHPVGLSSRNESLPFYAPTGRNQGIGSFDAASLRKGNASAGTLEVVEGDSYFEAKAVENIAVMKIDVEGFERHALEGLQATLRRWRPLLVCEITYGAGLSFDSLEELQGYLPENYDLYTFDTRRADGSKAKRRGSRAKRSGDYRLIPMASWRESGQDDVVACPREMLGILPGLAAKE